MTSSLDVLQPVLSPAVEGALESTGQNLPFFCAKSPELLISRSAKATVVRVALKVVHGHHPLTALTSPWATQPPLLCPDALTFCCLWIRPFELAAPPTRNGFLR